MRNSDPSTAGERTHLIGEKHIVQTAFGRFPKGAIVLLCAVTDAGTAKVAWGQEFGDMPVEYLKPEVPPKTIGDYLGMLGQVEHIQMQDREWLKQPVKSAWWSVTTGGTLYALCGGLVIAGFEPIDSHVTSRSWRLIVDDTDYNAWMVQRRDGREPAGSSAPATILKLVMSA